METTPQAFAEFAAGKKILIVDPNPNARRGAMKGMTELGVRATQITLLGELVEALAFVREQRPEIALVDYRLGDAAGTRVFAGMRQAGIPRNASILMLFSNDASESVMVQAVEEDVDAFLLKPYTGLQLREAALGALKTKLKPSPFARLLTHARALLEQGDLAAATLAFSHAAALRGPDAKPALALYYRGQLEARLGEDRKAEETYREGLGHDPLHYRCLTGLFDLLVRQRRSAEAYEITRVIFRNFPLSPDKLAHSLKHCVTSRKFEDIEELHSIFLRADVRTPDLVRHMSAALLIGGKYQMRARETRRKGIEMLRNASITCGGATPLLREVVVALGDNDETDEAEQVLKRFPSSSQGGGDFLASKLYLSSVIYEDPRKVLLEALQLIKRDVREPLVHRIAIDQYLKLGKKSEAEELVFRAGQLWPDKRAEYEAQLLGQAPSTS